MTINKVILVGNIGNDPEIRSTSDGREIANFSLATSESWKDKNTGERKSKTEWHKVSVFSQGLVGIIKNYVKKGTKVYLEGQLQTRKWTDNSGIEKYTTEIVLQNFNSTLSILDSKQSESNTSNDKHNKSFAKAEETFSDEIDDFNIPF